MEPPSGDRDSLRADAIIRELSRHRHAACSQCAGAMCGHEVLMSIALGLQHDPRCCACLAVDQRTARESLRDRMFMYLYARPCFRAAWSWANKNEGYSEEGFPGCLWPKNPSEPLPQEHGSSPVMTHGKQPLGAEWDAGSLGCGDLVLELRTRLQALSPGQILKVTAHDPGAPEDVPAWCRLTGHELVSGKHPQYSIKRKEK